MTIDAQTKEFAKSVIRELQINLIRRGRRDVDTDFQILDDHGNQRIGIAVRIDTFPEGIAFPLDTVYRVYKSGENIPQIVNSLLSAILPQLDQSAKEHPEEEDTAYAEFLNTGYDEVIADSIFAAGNTSTQNGIAKLLDRGVVYAPFLDLGIYPIYLTRDKATKKITGSYPIDLNYMRRHNVTPDMVMADVRQKTMQDPYLLQPYRDLKALFQEGGPWHNQATVRGISILDKCQNDDSFIANRTYVLSTLNGYFGSGLLYSPTVMTDIASDLQSDFYILPLSAHKLIVVAMPQPNDDLTHAFKTLMKDNGKAQREEDFLSDMVYFYRNGQHTISAVA